MNNSERLSIALEQLRRVKDSLPSREAMTNAELDMNTELENALDFTRRVLAMANEHHAGHGQTRDGEGMQPMTLDNHREYVRPDNLPDAAVRAATKYGKSIGHAGRVGGWIYDKNGRKIVQGWRSYARRLASSRRIYRDELGYHVDVDGRRF